MSKYTLETVISVHHWTDTLFTFKTTRDQSFRFKNGEFVMIGLEIEGKPLVRAYSLVSTNYEEQLEFLSIKVENGPLTSVLKGINIGDQVLVGRKATGTLITDNLIRGDRLYLLSTGTGIAPFISIVKDPETYERFSEVIVVHGCRFVKELAYKDYLEKEIFNDPYLSDLVNGHLHYYPTITRESYKNTGRLTELLRTEKLFQDLKMPSYDPKDRFMICGSPEMTLEIKEILKQKGYLEGNHGDPGTFVIEKAFVEKT